MPTYQYACTECGHQLEAVQSFSDAALTECPNCQGKLRKVFNSVGIVFKGSGFYRNDSRSGNVSAEKSGANESAKKESTSTTSSSSESSSSSSSTPSTPSTSSSSTTSSSSSSSSSSTKTPAAS
ncbi:FmdB family transcriptional regulator [Actinoplanes bogorensis]|uniref:FmdB family transcriptional regulator n=1 Tax=Paractinoplanes bogorensis TaxID=1610840 RepID=A0ABS5YJX6_9ACTN|nr:FmdB family zinc ribbon protein [Actinoplanes bogorensis]MBU2663004.1 FmdB family transcriptional regulator [Actinoplanes bogorensis]